MAWDIYGNKLYPGNCEVHPWVGEEYPCYKCREVDRQYEQQRYRDEAYRMDMEKRMQEDHYCEVDPEFKALCDEEKELSEKLSAISAAKEERLIQLTHTQTVTP